MSVKLTKDAFNTWTEENDSNKNLWLGINDEEKVKKASEVSPTSASIVNTQYRRAAT